jgi:predicted metal-dependent peptidase
MSTLTINNLKDSLARTCKDLMFDEPFYGLFLLSINKKWDKEMPTAGVCLNGINYDLIIQPEFWSSLSSNHQKGLLKHELLHIAFFHLTDYGHLSDKQVANIAMDLEINQYIDKDWLPEGGCVIDNEVFKPYNFPAKAGTQYYYDELMKQKKSNCQNIKAICEGLEKGDSSCTLPDGTEVDLTQHKWDDIAEIDEATKKMIQAQTGHVLQQIEEQVKKSNPGNIPGELAEILEKLSIIIPPKFDWKGYMRRFVGKSTKIYTKKSRRKLNKRLPDFPGLKIKKQKHVLAAIDTSGSVQKDELYEFFNELYHIKKTGTDVTLVECDTAISYIGEFDPKKDLEIHGRGGTSFQPVIDYYNKNVNKYSCLFYFTDGEACTPHDAKGNILWILSSVSNMNEDLPGSVIKLEL